jgi:hypothetical protein
VTGRQFGTPLTIGGPVVDQDPLQRREPREQAEVEVEVVRVRLPVGPAVPVYLFYHSRFHLRQQVALS